MTAKTTAAMLFGLLVIVPGIAYADDTDSAPSITVVNKTSVELTVRVAKRGSTIVAPGKSYSFSAGATCDQVNMMTTYFTTVVFPEPPNVGCNFSKCGGGNQAGADWSRAVFTCHYYPSGRSGEFTPLYEPEFDPKSGDIILPFTDANRLGIGAKPKDGP